MPSFSTGSEEHEFWLMLYKAMYNAKEKDNSVDSELVVRSDVTRDIAAFERSNRYRNRGARR